MGKTTRRKTAARKAIPDPELAQIAARRRGMKKITAGYAEISRLARRIVVVRATTEHELRQLANGILGSMPKESVMGGIVDALDT